MSNGPTKIDMVLQRLESIEQKQDDHGKKIYDMHGKVSKLEALSSIFGVVGGFLAALLARVGLGH